jgi:hypothetical protein
MELEFPTGSGNRTPVFWKETASAGLICENNACDSGAYRKILLAPIPSKAES